MELAPRTVQNMPDCFRRDPMTVLQPASITPEPAKRCWRRDSWLRNRAVETVRELLSDDAVRIIPHKGYSDCISMQTMRREGLTDILTHDKHFEQEGFRALFRDS
jgi:predicted nucleic acid-binding protein